LRCQTDLMATIDYFPIDASKELFTEFCVYYLWKFALMFLLLAVVLFRSREHENCSPQPGCVRAHIESKIQLLAYRPNSVLQSSKELDSSIFQRVLMSSIYYGLGYSYYLSGVLLIVYYKVLASSDLWKSGFLLKSGSFDAFFFSFFLLNLYYLRFSAKEDHCFSSFPLSINIYFSWKEVGCCMHACEHTEF